MTDEQSALPAAAADEDGVGADVGNGEGEEYRPGLGPRLQQRLQQWLQPAYLPLTALASVTLVVAAVFGMPLVAAIGLGIAVLTDWASTYPKSEGVQVLDRLGAGARTRAATRSLAIAITLATAGAPVDVVLAYGLLAVVVVASWLAFAVLLDAVIRMSPAIGVRNIGQGLELRYFFSRARRRRALGPYLVLTLEWLAVLGMAIALALDAAGLAVVAAGLGVAAIVAFVAFAAWWSRRFRSSGRVERYEAALMKELTTLAPDAIVYMSAGPAQAGYILNQWLPAFDRMSRQGVVIVREGSNVEPIADTSLPVIYAPSTRDVERFVLPCVKVAFYLANAGRNVHLQREPGIKHVFLNHGDSDKSTSANPVSRVYDEVWVAGQAALERYDAAGVDIPPERFAVVGRPQVDGLAIGPRPADQPRRLLYAPTFEGYYEEANYSSLEVMAPAMIAALIKQRPDIGIIFKPHPATGRMRRGMTEARLKVARMLRDASNPNHIVADDRPDLTLYECFDMADVLISDISSVVTDFLHTERPIITSNPRSLSHEQFAEMFPTQKASYILDRDLHDLIELVDAAFGDDPLREGRVAMKRYVLGDLKDGPIQTFSREVDRVCEEAVAHAARVRNTFAFTHEQIAQPTR